ncbi:transporter [Fructilactobacillus lindneri]|uniref:Transport protein n=2 Tax=Fructilactobacillus lindneri TaxID=53444 RepID=A0A0R2JNN6_9LACO|nr:DMT family transporter [Fructilactobacillus lindneri]ANZ57780.1 transporter [Fructilactobacillus lindneri]ANZ59049.1 transporter [Fructilactobacillus lindneri]KRN78779.1 transport protein [Fructilactobacillus lindneri DSM 20690 = JCM 11027]POG98102.1 transporter [Fructilactobacillus lindneri]POH01783.1 transporter [Fructilactobacillus lindneri]
MKKNKTYLGVILAISGALMWGIQGPVSQFLFQDKSFSTEWLMGIKMSIAGILILLFTKFVQKNSLITIWKQKTAWLRLLCYAVFGLAGVQYFFLLTVRASNSATATIMQSLGTVMIVILTALIYHQLPSKPQGIAVLVALVGTWLLVTKGDLTTIAIGPRAFGLGLTVALAGALQTMLPVKLIKKFSTFVVVGWAMVIGGLIFTCIHPFWMNAPHLSLAGIFGVAFIVIFGTMLSFLCFTSSLHYISPTTAGLLDTFEPLSATIGTVVFFNTSFNIYEIIGGILVLSTVFILAIKPKKQS